MVTILTPKEREAAVRRPSFCYLCGQPLGAKKGIGWNRDHVPASSYLTGRSAALPMRAHPECNSLWSMRDERAGQMIAILIGRYPRSPERTRIDVTKFTNVATGESHFAVEAFDFEQDVWRMIRAFHAALYGEFLSPDTPTSVSLPFPSGHAPNGVPSYDEPPMWHRAVVKDVLRAAQLDRVDRLTCAGGECEYKCTWIALPQAPCRCVWALRIHNWKDLGDTRFPSRGCVGYYDPTAPPKGASRVPQVGAWVGIKNPLDAFD